MPRALKVFRTPIGFHDAYVAAPSQKAALAKWGADADLFARGVAEQVTDPALMAEALARPGEIVRKVRGTMADHLAALPKDEPSPRPKRKAPEPRPKAKRAVAPRPRPGRDTLDAAEAALAEAGRQRAADERDLVTREAALAQERRALAERHEREAAGLERARAAAAAVYDRAMAAWRR